MPKKIKKSKVTQKQKQKNQKQQQTVIVNVSQPKKRVMRGTARPLFNTNQSASQSQASDLSKLIGMLIPKLQAESILGKSIPPSIATVLEPKEHSSLPIPLPSTELQSNARENLLGQSIKKTKRNKQEMGESRQMGEEDISSIKLGLTKYNFTPEPVASSLEPELPIVVGKKIRKNSMEDLQQRYFNQRGEYRNIPKGYTIKEFKLLVEKLEGL